MKGLSRGAALVGVAALAASCGGSVPPETAAGIKRLTVVVAVVDSLMPHEITAATPNLLALKNGGTFYAQSRSVFSAETIPNHVAMMTGVYPSRSGIPTNDFIDDFSVAEPEEESLDIPEKLTARTLFTWTRSACVDSGRNPDFDTAATLSKKYLYEIFRGDALNPDRANDDPDVFNVAPDFHWDPQSSPAYISEESEHTPDTPTMDVAVDHAGADFQFINLGDVDRLAHASGEQARNGALENADVQIGLLVNALAGNWDNTVLFLVSDHGMDYSTIGPDGAVTTQPMLDALGACFEPMIAVDSGATETIYVLDRAAPLADRQAALRAARACLLGAADCNTLCTGTVRPTNADRIAHAWYTTDDAADTAGTMPASVDSKHPNLGDLVLVGGDGVKFAETPTHQIPGNHGHFETIHNTMIVAGGSPWVKKGVVVASSVANPGPFDRLPEQSENIDIAPTVAWLLGLGIADADFPDYAERGKGFDGRVLKEAFTQFESGAVAVSPTDCGRF